MQTEERRKKICTKLYDIRPKEILFALAEEEKKRNRPVFSPPAPKDDLYFFLDNRNNFQQKEKFFSWKKIGQKFESFEILTKIKRLFLIFVKTTAFCLVVYSLGSVFWDGMEMKKTGLVKGQKAFAQLASAKKNISQANFFQAYQEFSSARSELAGISKNISGFSGLLVKASRFLPFTSKISSGAYLLSAGEDVSEAGEILTRILASLDEMKFSEKGGAAISYFEIFEKNEKDLKKAFASLESAQENLEKVNLDDVPSENRNAFLEARKKLPEINSALAGILSQERIIKDFFGVNGPRKYLFLFQNNQEMRATGGFIGTYAVLDIFQGKVRNFFIDGIFNPDGQLKERIIPPAPIQKISANWSLHDSNWFPNFPVSAEKAAFFYEKTGGPTVDGVVAMTPTVMQKMLEVTGPIEMPEYAVTVDSQNFIEKIQYEVEVDYDKELNQPKKILSDLAPKIFDRMLNSQNYGDFLKALNIIHDSLNERHILLYSKNWEIEKLFSENGWSGEILSASKDYLSVINTNINGFKTDGVIEEKITHQAKIQSDGTIINNLIIIRKHHGGNTPHDWWNRVNANYFRIYVPQGARLLSASGNTREFNSPPLDYLALGYKQDPQIKMEEEAAEIDTENGIKIYEDADKTVFAGWSYVSPQETVKIELEYVLPFRLNFDLKGTEGLTYSLLTQKQAGSLGSQFRSVIVYPDFLHSLWHFPENAKIKENFSEKTEEIELETDLVTDKFMGIAFSHD